MSEIHLMPCCLLLLLGMLYIARSLINFCWLDGDPKIDILDARHTTSQDKLRPAEIAYLVRGGDATHSLIVMAADLTLRALKSGRNGENEICSVTGQSILESMSEYERKMWFLVIESIKDWGKKKVKDSVLGPSKNPFMVARRISSLYNFALSSLKGVVQETFNDPMRLRKYFSPQGLVRIMADFASAGYKQAFEKELKASLYSRGYLVSEKRRGEAGKFLLLASLLAAIAQGLLCFFLAPDKLTALMIWLISFSGAFAGIFVQMSRQFIPLYDELALVAEQVTRKSFRVKLLRILLGSVRGLMILGSIALMVISTSLGLLLIVLCHPYLAIELKSIALAILSSCVAAYVIASMVFEGLALIKKETPSQAARLQLDQFKKELGKESPLAAFKHSLQAEEYDPKFSKILALYGIETLLILV